MKWVLIGVAAIVAVVVLVIVVGAILPKAHSAMRTARLAASPADVWAAITAFEEGPRWRSGLRAVERLADVEGKPLWRETTGHGSMTMRAIEWRPPERLVARIDDKNLPFGGTWTYDVRPAPGGGAVVTITEDGEIYNPIFRFMARFVFGYAATMETYLRDLGRRFGEEVTPAAPAAGAA